MHGKDVAKGGMDSSILKGCHDSPVTVSTVKIVYLFASNITATNKMNCYYYRDTFALTYFYQRDQP